MVYVKLAGKQMRQTRIPRCLKAGQKKTCSEQSLGELVYKPRKTSLVSGCVVFVNQSTRKHFVNYADYLVILTGCFLFVSFCPKVSDGGTVLRTKSSIAIASFAGCPDPLDAGFMLRHYFILSNCHELYSLAYKYNR